MKVKILIILITLCLSLLKVIEAEEEKSITFTLPQALLVNSGFSVDLPQLPQLEAKIIYDFDYLYGPDGRNYLKTKIGTLGLITTSVCKESRVLAITYASLPRSLPECEIVIPGGLKVGDVSDYALQMMVIPAKSGPKYLEVCLKTDQGYTKSIQLGIKGSTFVLIPLTLFGKRAPFDIEGIKLVVPRTADKDGIGGYFIKELKLVLKASGMN
jgi:hypothetical protein